MKIPIVIPALALASLATSNGANVIFSTGFETDTAGADPSGFSSIGEPDETTIEVSTTQASTGSNSLFMSDNSATNNPKLVNDFGANYGASTFTFDYRSTLGSNSFRVDFFNTGTGTKNFDMVFGGSAQGSIQFRSSGGSVLANSGSLAAFTDDTWHTISLEFDEAAGTANVFLDSTKVIDGYSNAGVDWTVGKFQLNMGYSSITGIEGYVDNVSFAVPEPSSALLVLSTLALGFTRRRR